MVEIDPTSLIVTSVTIFSVVYTIITIRKAGVTVFLLQIQGPLSILKRWLKLNKGRQQFLVGKFVAGYSEIIDESLADILFSQLIARGYQWDYFAFNDDGEIISMRKLYGNRQIHVRVFEDGEIRMHDEVNYEFEPIKHLQEPGRQAEKEDINIVLEAIGGTAV